MEKGFGRGPEGGKVVELFKILRALTLNVIEKVLKWRNQLDVIYKESVPNLEMQPVIWNETNYLIKMKSDLNWLASSEFSKILNFA